MASHYIINKFATFSQHAVMHINEDQIYCSYKIIAVDKGLNETER